MWFKLVSLLAVLPTVYTVPVLGIAQSELFLFGTNVGDSVVNVHGRTEAQLLDHYVQLTIPTTLPDFQIFGANLGKSVFVSTYTVFITERIISFSLVLVLVQNLCLVV